MPRSSGKTAFARGLRRNLTDAERALWARLSHRQLMGVKFQRQQPIGPYIVDFVTFEHKVVVEVDGGQHGEASTQTSDDARTAWLEQQSFKVLRVWNHDVLQNTEGVLESILAALR